MSALLSNRRARLWVLGAVCVTVAMVFAGRGLGDEAYLSTHGDPPRYMMNAMFILDLLRDRPFESLDALREYSTLYYARYPALSLGHHAPLLSVLQVPFLALLGPSITAMRLPLVLSAGMGVLFLFLFVTEVFDEWAGAVAGLFLAMNPTLVLLEQAVLSEPVSLAATLGALYYLHRFCSDQRRWQILTAGVFLVLSVLAKQNAVVTFPALAAYGLARLGWRGVLRRDILVTAIVVGAIAAAFVGATAATSTLNVRRSTAALRQASSATAARGQAGPSLLTGTFMRVSGMLPSALRVQMTTAGAVTGLVAMLLLVVRRRPEAWLAGLLLLVTFAFMIITTQRQEMPRYGVYWLPGLALAVGSLLSLPRARTLVALVAAAVLATEANAAARVRLEGFAGYEEAARYVTSHPRGASVMFSGDVDSGFFIFFVRKHDEARRSIVLRSDKVLTVSLMRSVASTVLIDGPEEIEPKLRSLGVGYIVIEDRPSLAAPLEWLRQELRRDTYREVVRIPVGTRDRRLAGTDLVVYEVAEVNPPDPKARLDLRLPIISREFDVPLSDLLARKRLR